MNTRDLLPSVCYEGLSGEVIRRFLRDRPTFAGLRQLADQGDGAAKALMRIVAESGLDRQRRSV